MQQVLCTGEPGACEGQVQAQGAGAAGSGQRKAHIWPQACPAQGQQGEG